MKHSTLYFVSLIFSFSFVLSASVVLAGTNDGATFVLDLQTTQDDSQLTSLVDTTPVFSTVDVNGETRTRFAATVVLKDASQLIGANCDLVFDKSKLQVVEIHEVKGDLNFDGRSNVADVLTLAERYGESTETVGLSYLDLDSTGTSANKIDDQDLNVLTPLLSETSLFWTNNPNADLSTIRESVEIFESPASSNQNGKIDDVVVVLLSRIHPTPSGFGFIGDARIAEILFEVVPGATGDTTLSFEDVMAIDESTEITQSQIVDGSTPKVQNVVITLP